MARRRKPVILLSTCVTVLVVHVFFLMFREKSALESVKTKVHTSDRFAKRDKTHSVTSLPLCPISSRGFYVSGGVDETEVSLQTLGTKFMYFMRDGHSQPVNCTRKQKIAIIIPFLDRHQHLSILLNNLIPHLVRKLLDFTIIVTELVAGVKFNRAMLMNVGFKEAQKHGNFNCFIFHDVDKIPESNLVPYECLTNRSYHLSSSLSMFNYTYRPFYAGGVLAFPKSVFEAINGYSNLYFGWGFEDNDIFQRLKFLNGEPLEPPTMFGAFRSLTHTRDDHNEKNPIGTYLLFEAWLRARYEGLTSLRYRLEKTEIQRICIWKTVSYDKEYYDQQIKDILGKQQRGRLDN